ESAGNGANRPKMTMLRRSQRKFVGECRIGMKARLRRVVLHSRECSRCRGVRCGCPQGLVYDEGQQGCRGCRTAASGVVVHKFGVESPRVDAPRRMTVFAWCGAAFRVWPGPWAPE